MGNYSIQDAFSLVIFTYFIRDKYAETLVFTGFSDYLVFDIHHTLIPMKQNLFKGLIILLVTFFCAISCKKSLDPSNPDPVVIVPPHDTTQSTPPVPPPIPYPVNPVPECSYAPDYGDSVIYTQPATNGDYYVYPQNNQGIQGTYLSWPGGLVMNSKTGSIDLTQSQTGERYSVAFVKDGTTDTCMSQLIVAGAYYMDSVYVVTMSDTLKPYFNANPNWPSPCLTNQGEGCKFDYNNYAKNQGIVIDQKTGNIDINQTMKNSLFGLLPLNGMTVNTTIYYWLNDNSNYADQKVPLQMVYYNHRSDIPPNLLTSITNTLLNTLGDLLLSKSPAPRPPLIIIVRDNN